MNKNDTEMLGYILSISNSISELQERIFDLDSRIKPHFEGFEEVNGRSEEVDKLFEKIMIKRYGNDWSFKKEVDTQCAWDEARKKVYCENWENI